MITKKQLNYPKVLIVGRTNVGKSTLFNRISNDNKSIVFERSGVTRDYIAEQVTWKDKTFNLIDTGGMSFQRGTSDIDKLVQEKVNQQLTTATLLLFVVDVKSGVTQEDLFIAQLLHKSKKPVVLVINKIDNSNAAQDNLHEFNALGFEQIIEVSSLHGVGMASLLEFIIQNTPDPLEAEPEKPQFKIAIIGKPNVGKSSLMNLLTLSERSIVSDVAGTTREAISELVYHANDLIQITDTAGVRRKASVDDDLEKLMVKSTMQTVRDADVVILMIDSSEGALADQELKLLFYAVEEKKPLIILYNKTDLLKGDEYTRGLLNQNLDKYEFILKKIPQIAISCLSKKNVNKIMEEVQKIIARCQQPFNSTQIDEIVKGRLANTPLYHKKQILRLFKIRHVAASIPTFVLHVNHPEWFGDSQLGFIENILRANFDLKGVPVRFSVRKV